MPKKHIFMLHLFYTESSQKIKAYLRKVKIRAAAGLPDAIQRFFYRLSIRLLRIVSLL